jgi:hypothetical protein
MSVDLSAQTDGASWYDSNNDGEVGDAEEGWGTTAEVSDGGWNFESTYFENPKSSGMMSRRINGVLVTAGSIVLIFVVSEYLYF